MKEKEGGLWQARSLLYWRNVTIYPCRPSRGYLFFFFFLVVEKKFFDLQSKVPNLLADSSKTKKKRNVGVPLSAVVRESMLHPHVVWDTSWGV